MTQLTFRYQGLAAPIIARFDIPYASSDGGLVLLKAVDEGLRLTETVAAGLMEGRQAGKVAHSLVDLVRQRVFGLAAGYHDAARLADDPLYKLVLDREPLTGPALGSQPTLSRFENAVGQRELVRVGHGLARTVIAHHRRRLHGRARRITIDLDPTDDPTHGQQELSFFNGHYDTACYLPLVTTLRFDDDPIQYLAGIVLRPGNAPAGRGAIGRLRWLLRALRRAFPRATLRVRLDGDFAGPRRLAFLDGAGVEYVVGLPGNARLDKRVRRLLGRAWALFRHRAGDPGVRRDTLRGPKLGPPAARDHEGRVRPVSRAGPPSQSALRRDQPGAGARGGLRDLPPAGRRRKSTQGAQGQPRSGPDQLPALPGQPVSRPADGYRLHPVPNPATARPGAQLRRRPGRHAAGAPDQARGPDHRVGAPHRAAPAAGLSLARALAAGRAGGRRSSQRTAAPSPRPACPTSEMVSLPGPASTALPARRGRPSGGIGPHLGRVDLREVVRCDRGVYQGRATHVVRAFANRSG
jgi:hypothetical protein